MKLALRCTAVAACLALVGCATPTSTTTSARADGYGPLAFNKSGGDFYFAQDGKFAGTELGSDGAIVVHLKRAPFQIGYNGRQLNIALSQASVPEISTDPHGFKASRLSGPMAGARDPNSDVLLVYTGKLWSDGNTEFSDDTSRKTNPMAGYKHAYLVNQVEFVDDAQMSLQKLHAPVYGYIVVYKQHERMNRDIMPIRLVFE
jgi:hypothetical protein